MIKKLLDHSLIRFLLVGVANTIFGTAVMALFYSVFKLDTGISTAANYFFGGILSFFLNKRFTFKNNASTTGEYVRQIAKFALTVAVCWFIAYSAAKPIMQKILSGAPEVLRDYGVMFGCMAIYTGLNYLGQRYFAFSKRSRT